MIRPGLPSNLDSRSHVDKLRVKLNLIGRIGAMTGQSGEAVRYSVVLRPHRSAGAGSVRTLICLVALAWFAVGIVFVLVGAWPVAPFLGLEIENTTWTCRDNKDIYRFFLGP